MNIVRMAKGKLIRSKSVYYFILFLISTFYKDIASYFHFYNGIFAQIPMILLSMYCIAMLLVSLATLDNTFLGKYFAFFADKPFLLRLSKTEISLGSEIDKIMNLNSKLPSDRWSDVHTFTNNLLLSGKHKKLSKSLIRIINQEAYINSSSKRPISMELKSY